MAFAVIKTGGKQYRVSPGNKLRVEKLEVKEGEDVTFNEVLLKADGDNVTIGTPEVKGSTVTAKVLSQGRGDKLIISKYKNKIRHTKKSTHRQPYTEVEITAIK